MSELLVAPCDNFAMCGDESGSAYGSPNWTTCMSCGPWFRYGFGFGKLDISTVPLACETCSQMAPSVKYPQCSHRACPACFKSVMYWDQTQHHLSRVPYGCPPCPNGCVNPTRGRQCDCYEYDSTVEAWESSFPSDELAHNLEEEKSRETPIETNGCKKCPTCDARYDRQVHGHMPTGHVIQMFHSQNTNTPTCCYECQTEVDESSDEHMTCSKCNIATYCGSACQIKHWIAGHSKECRTLIAAS
jgi:hypothetical protein